MATTSVTFPKDFSLNKLVLTPLGGEPIDLRFQMMELNVHEDLFNSTTYGTLTVNDALNQLNKLPIFGFETLEIDFNTPQKNPYSGTFRVYKISDRVLAKEREQLYILHFTSEEMFTNLETVVSKSYKGKLISDIADDIQTHFLGSTFGVLETTKYLHHIVIPNWTPMNALNWLAARANSAVFQGANYFYFQNQNGYNFQSGELLSKQPAILDYLVQPANIREPYFSDAEFKIRDLDRDRKAVEAYHLVDHISVIDDISRGMYGNRLTTHNLPRKIWTQIDWTYGETWLNYTHIEDNIRPGGKSFLSDQESSDDSPESLLRLYNTEQDVPKQLYPNRVENWMNARISQIQQLKNVRVHITVPGDSERTIGEVVNFQLPSPEPPVNKDLVMDKYYQGRYLVTSVRHTINQHQYTSALEITKDAVFTAYP
jgi:hypothetical protein